MTLLIFRAASIETIPLTSAHQCLNYHCDGTSLVHFSLYFACVKMSMLYNMSASIQYIQQGSIYYQQDGETTHCNSRFQVTLIGLNYDYINIHTQLYMAIAIINSYIPLLYKLIFHMNVCISKVCVYVLSVCGGVSMFAFISQLLCTVYSGVTQCAHLYPSPCIHTYQ